MSSASSAKSLPDSIISVSSSNDSSQNAEESIRDRRSRELIIGLCETVGSGVGELYNVLAGVLVGAGYSVHHIKLSELIIAAQPKDQHKSLSELEGVKRILTLQNLGDKLRQLHSESVIAKYAIRHIKTIRDQFHPDPEEPGNTKTVEKVAYIVDQFKNPSEVKLFKQVYRNNFYLIGIISSPSQRTNDLASTGADKNKLADVIERDRRGDEDFKQQVEDTLHRSDFFIKHSNRVDLKSDVERLNNLIHGVGNITPKSDETGMYHAFSASLRSACLSRQVGASIMNASGEIISTGCNDVPKSGGGLYTSDTIDDRRCFNQLSAQCHNDKHKNILKGQIVEILNEFNIENSVAIAKSIVKNTKIKSLIEYSRAVHAEMDALITLTRSPNIGSVGNTLYCTTYPCHNCAKHIIASGIKRVVYIEPYEKSLASDLHEDAIELYHGQNVSPLNSKAKVQFEVFEGVSPSRYVQFFRLNQCRKTDNGKAIDVSIIDAYHVDSQQLDSYVDYEGRVVLEIESITP